MKWIALFSQTGSEINSLTKTPDLIITNNMDYDGPLQNVVQIEKAEDVYSYLIAMTQSKEFLESIDEPVIITLHGWLKIVPGDVIEQLPPIFNGHPAPITLYPELKGLDPQVRLWEGLKTDEFKCIGSVIHEVTASVDEGTIMFMNTMYTKPASFEDMDTQLRKMSRSLWELFLEVKLNGR